MATKRRSKSIFYIKLYLQIINQSITYFIKGFLEHNISTSNEWCLTIVSFAVFISLIPDFKKVKIAKPKAIVKGEKSNCNFKLYIFNYFSYIF